VRLGQRVEQEVGEVATDQLLEADARRGLRAGLLAFGLRLRE
jgi:hypothetical protein